MPAFADALSLSTSTTTTPSDDVHVECLCEFGVQRLHADAEPAALHFAVLDQLRHDRRHHVARYREADADVAAGGRENCGVDADQLAAQIHQRATRIAGVDRRIGLNEIFVTFDAEATAPERADDARRHGLVEPERIADRNHVVADAQPARIGERDLRELARVDFQHREIHLRVGADRASPATRVHRDNVTVISSARSMT